MKGVEMYYKVQALVSESKSLRAIAEELGINRRTVKKFASLSLSEANQYYEQGIQRRSEFDVAKGFISDKLIRYNKIRSSNLFHQVKERYPDIKAGERSFRNYIRKLKDSLPPNPEESRVYEPVDIREPGVHQGSDRLHGCGWPCRVLKSA
ncbi:MAG: hypothetical protein PHC50_05075 [Candidatus Cloacimonetes bacterium]|nr:hypothetical protein [Candidatus Cloacimonadota bacterium]